MRFPIFANAIPPAAALVVSLAPSTGRAAVVPLASYPFNSNSSASTDIEPLTTATSITVATGWTGSNNASPNDKPQFASNVVRVDTTATGAAASNDDTLAEAISLNTYVGFTLQANGNPLSLSSLTFDQGLVTSGVSTNATVTVMSSLTGFASGNEINTFNLTSATDTSAAQSVSLTAGTFQNVTGNIEFRFYFYDGNDAATRYQTLDNIQLSGAVPEPSTLGGMGIAMGVFCARRRRRCA